MPTVRKLAPEEVETLEYKPKGQRKLTEEEYDRYLADLEIGDYGEAILEEGENRLTVRNRFKAAAVRRGLDIEFRRTSDPLVRFKIVAHNGHMEEQPHTAEPEPEPEPAPSPAKKKGGRPKKAA